MNAQGQPDGLVRAFLKNGFYEGTMNPNCEFDGFGIFMDE